MSVCMLSFPIHIRYQRGKAEPRSLSLSLSLSLSPGYLNKRRRRRRYGRGVQTNNSLEVVAISPFSETFPSLKTFREFRLSFLLKSKGSSTLANSPLCTCKSRRLIPLSPSQSLLCLPPPLLLILAISACRRRRSLTFSFYS